MIAANVAAARFLDRYKVPTLYRVHGLPETRPARNPAHVPARVRPLAAGPRRDHARPPARPAAEDRRPARRRPDLDGGDPHDAAGGLPARQHRSLRARARALRALHLADPALSRTSWSIAASARCCADGDPQELIEWHGPFPVLGQDCSFRERRADEATRSAVAWLKCFYMQDRIGEEFDGIVSGVVDFGLFVQLDGLQVDGLLHVSALGADYFGRDSSGFRMIGRSSGKIFKLGDRAAGARDERLARRSARRLRTRR